MSELLSYQPSNSAVYYTPRKRIELLGTVLGFLVAALLTVIGSIIYATVQPSLHSSYLRIGGAVVAGFCVGQLGRIPVRYGRIQLPLVVAFLAAALAFLSLYVMWVTWTHNAISRFGGRISYGFLLTHPDGLFRVVRILSRTGTWTYKGEVIRGPALVGYWFLEAGWVLGAGVLIPLLRKSTDDPVCTECGSTCRRIPTRPRFGADREAELIGLLENRQFTATNSFEAPRHEDDPELSIRLLSCPRCYKTNVLTLNRIAWHMGTNGRPTVRVVPLINQLLVTREEAEQIEQTCEEIRERRQAARDAAEGGEVTPISA